VLPTPRGGGVAIVISFVSAVILTTIFHLLPSTLETWTILGGCTLVATIGFIDDHRPISARWRLLGHFIAATIILIGLGGLPLPLALGDSTFLLDVTGWIVGLLFCVWMLNLYNFMDGIDGLASLEAIFVTAAGASLYFIVGSEQNMALPLILAFCVAGFLIWNFPPAKIFMGDAGSGFLGILLASLALQAGWVSKNLLWAWIILLGVFIVDASWTLLRRLLRGEKIYEAHRMHAYQNASRRYQSHKIVTLAILGLNLIWLFPCAYLVATNNLNWLTGIIVAYTPLLGLAIYFNAGKPEITHSETNS
tara:strand:- start:8237 stop:9157 length:921 start_codon:yes stop_codon:yes gene_type:complete